MSARNALFALAAAAILAVLFVAFRPAPPDVASLAPPAAVSAPASPVATQPLIVEFVIKNGQRFSGPARISLRQGDAVELRITSDRADELHLHGYDLSAPLQPEAAASLSFIADRSGRFELELHRAHLELAVLEVEPRP